MGEGAQSEKKTPEIRWLSRSEDDDDYNEDEDCKDYDDVNENVNDYYENEDEMKMI